MADSTTYRERLNLPGLATIGIVVAGWELVIRSGVVTYEYLPAPSAIAGGLWELAVGGQLLPDTLHTLRSVLIGWALAVLIGVSLGLLLGASTAARRYSLATIEVLRPMPGIALVPLALLLFGFSLETELLVIVLPALWPVLINTMGGVMGIHARLVDVGRTLRLSRGALAAKILVPAALPAILVGARISMSLALVLAVIAEMVGNPEGLGYGLVREQQALRPDTMFGYVVIVGILGILLNAALERVAAIVLPGAAGRAREGR